MPELQYEVVVPDNPVRLQSLIHLAEVHRTTALVNLHRVASTQRDVRTPFTPQMNKVAFSAGAASSPRLRGLQLGAFIRPDVNRPQRAPPFVRRSGQQFDRLGRF